MQKRSKLRCGNAGSIAHSVTSNELLRYYNLKLALDGSHTGENLTLDGFEQRTAAG